MTNVVLSGDPEARAWIERDVPRETSPERRDPRAATMLTTYQSPTQAMVPDWNPEQALRLAYYANVFAYAAVRAVATDIAALPFRVGDPDTGEYDPNHPMAVHFSPPPGGPNPVTSARKLLAWSIAQRLITGRIAWEVELGPRDRPIAYWPLTSRYLDAFPSRGGSQYFGRFEYGPPHDKRTLDPSRVFYDWNPSADDWRQPESCFQAARLDLSVAVRQDIYDDAFLKNNAQPATVVVHQMFATAEERDAFREQFRSTYGGERNAGKVAFAEAEDGENGVTGSIDIQTLGLSQRDGEFIARYDQKIRGILIAVGVPMSRLGWAKGETFSNSGQEWTNYWQGTNVPIMRDLADSINIQLLPKYGVRASSGVGFFDTSEVAALQESAQYAQAQVPDLVNAGIFVRDEARCIYGEGPHPDPEIGASTGPLNSPPSTIVNVNPSHPETPPSGAMPAMTPPALTPASAAAPTGGVRGYQPADTEVRRTNIYRAAAAQIRLLEHRWERQFKALFAKQEAATIDRLEGKRGRQALNGTRAAADTIFDQHFWTASTQDIAAGLYEDVFAIGGARLAEKFGMDFTLDAPGVAEAIGARANKLAGQVTETTFKQIRDQLDQGTKAGEGIPELADRIRSVFSRASDARATTIARTEVVSSYNSAGRAIAQQLGPDVVGGREWIATRDGRTREDHADADGQVVAVDEPYDVGGESLDYPGDEAGSPENTVNCRCTEAYLTPDEMGNQ